MYVGALTTSLTMFLSALSSQAIAALWGEGDGYQISAKGDGYAWGQSGNTAVNSWRVTLYVSTKDDGTIDPATDAIGSSTLAKVGTIVYDNIFAADSNADVFVSASEHAETRSANWKDYTCVSPVKATDRQISGSGHSLAGGGDKIYHKTSGPTELPMYGAYANEPSGSEPFIQQVIEDLNDRLGGSTGNFKPLYLKVGSLIGKEPQNKIKAANYDYDLLLPTNSDCVVQWACVVEPLVERRTNTSGTFFEAFVYDLGKGFYYNRYMIQIPEGPCQYMLLDAYETAQYNEASRKLYSTSESLYSHSGAGADEQHIEYTKSKTTILDLTTKTHTSSTCLEKWGECGQLAGEWGNLLANSATVCYDTHSGYSYCGVPVAGASGSGLNYWSTSAAKTAATYGGIAVLLSKLEDDENKVPVYYYVYDENNRFTGQIHTEYFDTGTDKNNPNLFVPSTSYGIPIADESLNSGSNAYNEYKDFWNAKAGRYYTAGYLREGNGGNVVTDAKGNPQTGVTIITDVTPVTEKLKTYSSYKRDFVKSIHVKTVKAPSVDIYYHTYTYTVPDECWDEVNNALRGLEGLEYEKKLEELAKQYGFADKYTVTVTKREMPLT